MAKLAVNPNRMELLKLKRRLAVAKRGHKLLKDKLDELMKRFMSQVRQTRDMREDVERKLNETYRVFGVARSEVTTQEVEEAVSFNDEELLVGISTINMMSVKVPEFEIHKTDDYAVYGLAMTPAAFDEAIAEFNEIIVDMIRLSEIEESVKLLAMEIEKTRRRVNALEHVLIPSLEETITYITMKLDELERGYRTQLMKIKEMVQD